MIRRRRFHSPGAGEAVIQALDPATRSELGDKPGIKYVTDEADRLLRAALSSLELAA